MRRVLVPLLGAAVLHCGDSSATTDGASATTTATTTATTSTDTPTTTATPTTTGDAGSDSHSASATTPTTPTSGGSNSASGTTSGGSEDTGTPTDECATSPFYRVGAGIADVTGPSAELVMMGYSQPTQKAEGISTRLWARAFVVESQCTGGRVVFVSADLGQVFQAVHLEVLARLEAKLRRWRVHPRQRRAVGHAHPLAAWPASRITPSTTSPRSASTPTTSRPSSPASSTSIVRAHDNLGDGVIKIAQGPLQDASWNRSPQAYAQQPRRRARRLRGRARRATSTPA